MNINIDSVMSKVEAWSKTEEGKHRMKETVERYQKEGRTTTAAGSKIINEQMMTEAAAKFISILQSTARSTDLPESIMKHFASLKYSSPVRMPDGSRSMTVYFEDDLHRDSLDNELGYDGIKNIVALFNNGYHAKNYVYGWWDGHRATGDGVLRSGYDNDFAWVRSKKEREPLRFIQQAVADFNASYGAEYGVTAIAGTAYE